MIKGSFFIYGNFKSGSQITHVKEVNGYLFDVDGLIFGVNKNYKSWSITEIKTGLLIGRYARTLKQCKEQITPELIKTIKDIMIKFKDNNWRDDCIKAIAEAYENAGYMYEYSPD